MQTHPQVNQREVLLGVTPVQLEAGVRRGSATTSYVSLGRRVSFGSLSNVIPITSGGKKRNTFQWQQMANFLGFYSYFNVKHNFEMFCGYNYHTMRT